MCGSRQILKSSHRREAFLILEWKNAIQRLVQEINIAGFPYSIFGSLEMSYTLSTANTVYGEYLTYLVFKCLPYHIPILFITAYHRYDRHIYIHIFICASTFYMFFSHLICSSPDVKHYVRTILTEVFNTFLFT